MHWIQWNSWWKTVLNVCMCLFTWKYEGDMSLSGRNNFRRVSLRSPAQTGGSMCGEEQGKCMFWQRYSSDGAEQNIFCCHVIWQNIFDLSSQPRQLNPWREGRDVWCLPPVWADIWFRFTISSLVLLPTAVAVSFLSLFCLLVHSPDSFPQKSSIFFIEVGFLV